MASIRSVEEHAQQAKAATDALHAEAIEAVEAGIPRAAVARAAGVAYNTLNNWMKQA